MKKIFSSSSFLLKSLGYFNFIVGISIVLVFLSGSILGNVATVWDSTNKEVEVGADIILPSVNTIIDTNGWNSQNNNVVVPVATSTMGSINTSNTGAGWNSVNKPIVEPYGSNTVIGSESSTTKTYYSSTTTIKPVQKEIPTIKISTIKNNEEENIKVSNDLKIIATSTKKVVAEEKKIPFYAPVDDIWSKIQDTINTFKSFGTTTGEITMTKTNDVDLLFKDTNKDGVSDYDSLYIYNLDPIKTSSTIVYDGKKINAGEKILLGIDPTATSAIMINHEEPDNSSAKITKDYVVENITLNPEKLIVLKGRALPNSFITLYVYSTPIIVTVKADSNGEWEYILNKELEDGQHVVYAATVNNTGKILAKSDPFAFAKTAEAATLVPTIEKQVVDMKPEVWNSKYTIMIVGFLILSVLAVLFVIGIGIKKNANQLDEVKKDDISTPII